MAPYDNFTLVSADILKVDLLSEIQKFKKSKFTNQSGCEFTLLHHNTDFDAFD